MSGSETQVTDAAADAASSASALPGAVEYSLSYSDTGGASQASGDLADAIRIQTVLFGHPRAGDSQFGVNVRNYLMEISDGATLQELQVACSGLIARYCPLVEVQALVVQVLTAAQSPQGRGTNSLVIGVSLGNQGNTFPFAIVVTAGTSGTVVSQLVF